MAGSVLNCGNYEVLLDAGFFTNEFTLDVSELDGTDALDGNISYFDVTQNVLAVSIRRGRRSFRDRMDAGQASIQIHDANGDFSVVNQNSPYWNPVRGRLGFEPTKRVQILREGERLFVGQIVDYEYNIELDGDAYVTIQASDDLLTLSNVKLNAHVPTEQFSGQRMNAILNRSEVNLFTGVGQRVIEDGVAYLGAYPVEQSVNVRDYFERIQVSEYGRYFIDRQGRFQFDRRIGRVQYDNPLMLSDEGDGGVGYSSFRVIYQ